MNNIMEYIKISTCFYKSKHKCFMLASTQPI